MSISNENKQDLIKTYAINPNDTGSPEVHTLVWV